MAWLSGNSEVLNVFINFGMLLVWMFYAQLLLNGYRRARRPKILVNQGIGQGMESVCLVANMSNEAIFVQVVVASLYNREDRLSRAITELRVRSSGDDSGRRLPLQEQTIQGPLQPGNYVEMGTYWEIIDTILSKRRSSSEDTRDEDADTFSLEVTVIASYGSENQPIGARRSFEFLRTDSGDHMVRPTTVDTLRMTGFRDRRRMHRWLQEYL